MRSPTSFILCSLVLTATLAAQRPRTLAEALQRFEQVKERAENERTRAASDLGEYADDSATAVLLAELDRAQSLGHRQAVVRALGKHPRAGAVPPLQQTFASGDNARLLETVAEALAAQGEDGVQVLIEALTSEKDGSRRNAVCSGLERASGDAARDALIRAVRRDGGRSRLAPLRALRPRAADAVVDALRQELVGDKDALVAATALQQLAEHQHAEATALAVDLARRTGSEAGADVQLAVLHGLLLAPEPTNYEAMLRAASAAEDPFGKARASLWQTAMREPTLVRWLAEKGVDQKSPRERAVAAMALGFADTPHQALAAGGLTRCLAQKDIEVVRAAATGLATLGRALGLAPLQRLLTSGAEPMQAVAVEALHRLQKTDDGWVQQLTALAEHNAVAVRTAALQLLGEMPTLLPDTAVALAQKNLEHKAWPVRAAAMNLLVAARHASAVPLLFERLDQEQGRLLQDLIEALRELTALQFPTTKAWRDWWQKESAGFRVVARKNASGGRSERRGPPTTASYWDIPVHSDRVVFVVDVSGSMTQPFGTSGTRLDEAKRQLTRVLGLLPAKARTNIVAFADETTTLANNLEALDGKKKKGAETFVGGLNARGATNVHAALHCAFADPNVDTIFLLTDGQPSAGPVVDAEALAAEVRRWNVSRQIRIHTVAIGGKSRLLEQLAADSGGEHTTAR